MSSEHVLAEVERALARPYFAKKASAADRVAYVALLRREALLVTPRTKVQGAASHPEDDRVLAAALDGDARFLVSGDRALRALVAFRGIQIVSPREFLEIAGPELGIDARP